MRMEATLRVVLAIGMLNAAWAPAKPATGQAPPAQAKDTKPAPSYSGMYTFLKEGEFLQVSVEDEAHVTGFVSRYGEGEKDQAEFVDQFFKSAKLEGNKLSFTTETLRGTWFEFKGTVERGEGKSSAEEGFYVLKGTLTQSTTAADKKVSSQTREVVFKMFPQEASSAPSEKN